MYLLLFAQMVFELFFLQNYQCNERKMKKM